MKKNSLHYELYGSSTGAGKKGYWRWAIFAGREKKPLLVGSFYGTFEKANHREQRWVVVREEGRLEAERLCPDCRAQHDHGHSADEAEKAANQHAARGGALPEN